MKAAEAANHLERRRQRLKAEMETFEETCAQLGQQLADLRKLKAEAALELASLERALDALQHDVEPAEVV